MLLGPFDGSMLGNGKGVVRVRRWYNTLDHMDKKN